MKQEVRIRFAEHVEPGEDVLWVGRPQQGIVFRSSDAPLILISTVWLGFAANWAWAQFAIPGAQSFKVAGVIFILIGLYLAIGRFFVDAQLRRQTLYAITSRRILILGGFAGKNVVTFEFPLPSVSVSDERGERATVRFGPRWPFMRWHATYWREPEFFGADRGAIAAGLLRNFTNVR